ncbi:MAG: RHS repeat-associated core domain-containing protein [Verrucomicrobiia bacterium]
MAFWIILIKIAKVVMTVRKYAGLLSALKSGKLVESLIGEIIIGRVCNALVNAGIPVDKFDFVDQAKHWIEKTIDKTAGDLAKHGLVIAPDVITNALVKEVELLLDGKSVGGGKGSARRQSRAADPILVHRGEFERESVDLFLRGAGVDLQFRRVYRSSADYLGPMGRGWDHNFNIRLFEKNAYIVTRLTGKLSVETYVRHPDFGQSGFNYYAPPDGVHDVLVANAATSYDLLRPNAVVWEFENCAPGEHRAKRLRTPGGNNLECEYNAEGLLERVYVNSRGRYIEFTYDTRHRITKLFDHTGRTTVYEYDDHGYLGRVTQWTEVAGKLRQIAESYEYVSVGQSRRLWRVCDERGQSIVENEYDTRPTSDSFGYVIRQVTEAGPTCFTYEDIPGVGPLADLLDPDRPEVRVFETGPEGHVIERILNGEGNELLRREDFTDGAQSRTAMIRSRYNADGSLVARMEPEGNLTQYLYGRDEADQASLWFGGGWTLLDLTQAERMAFGNQLAKVERGRALGLEFRYAEQPGWLASLPSPRLRAHPDDAIVKTVYDAGTQLPVSRSDPLHTVSPSPSHVESAPVGSALYDPFHLSAISHRKHLTKFEYDTEHVLRRTIHPGRIRPAAIGGSLPESFETVIAADLKRRPLERQDRSGYRWYSEYYPEATLGSDPRAGFLKRELRPHLDWSLNDLTLDILEISRTGAWEVTTSSIISSNVAPADFEVRLEGARVELWQSEDGAIISGHTSVRVFLDGALHGTWDQTTQARYVMGDLPRGVHVVKLAGAYPASFSIGRVLAHIALDYEVDSLGRVVRQIDGRGTVSETAYDALDRVIEVKRGAGVATSRVRTVFNQDGQVLREEAEWRDSAGLPLGGGWTRKEYRYNARGLLISEKAGDNAGARELRYFYDSRGQPIAFRDKRGIRTTFRYDALGRRVRMTRAACTPDESTVATRFDRNGKVLMEIDPLGGKLVNGRLKPGSSILPGYDDRGRLRVTTDARGHVIITQYDLAGRDIVTSRFSLRSTGGYDLIRRTASVRDEHGDVIEKATAVFDAPIATADPFDAPDSEYLVARSTGKVIEAKTLFLLDQNGRATLTVGPSGGATVCRFDPQGRPAEERLVNGRQVLRRYDPAGNLIRACAFENAHSPASGLPGKVVFLEEYAYDALNRRTLIRDAYGNEWRSQYDSLGNLTKTEGPLGSMSTFEYNAFGEETKRAVASALSGTPSEVTTRNYDREGNLVLLIDPVGSEFRFAHDHLSRLKRAWNASYATDPGSTYEYDRADHLIKLTDRNGLIHRFAYDLGGHRVGASFDWSAVPAVWRPSALSPSFLKMDYDAAGDVVRQENDWSIVMLKRNSLGLILEESTTLHAANGIAASAWVVGQTFDSAGNRTSLTSPSGRVVTYAYDQANRVTKVANGFTPGTYPGGALTTGAKALAEFEYAGSRWTRTNYPLAGMELRAEYEGRGQICDQKAIATATGKIIWRMQSLLDAGRRTALITEVVPAGIRSRRFQFDLRDMLIGYVDVAGAWADLSALAPPGHAVDPALSTAQTAITALSQFTIAPTNTFAYDLSRNRTMVTQQGATEVYATDADNRYQTVASRSLVYDGEGQLLSDGIRRYGYSAEGLVVEEFELPGGGAPLRSVGYIRDPMGRVVACITSNGVQTFAYVDYSPVAASSPSGSSEFTFGKSNSDWIHMGAGGHDTWAVVDRLHSPRALVKTGPSPGATVLSYLPFGEVEPAAVIKPIFGFAGMLQFPASALLHSFARSYSPALGRHLQQDSAGLLDGPNPYVYAQNNPVDFFDPHGFQALTPSHHKILGTLESVAAELGLDPAHVGLGASVVGDNKHLEMQFAAKYLAEAKKHGLSGEEAARVATEIIVDESGKIRGVDLPPNFAQKVCGNTKCRTVDLAIVKEGVMNGRDGILNKQASEVLDFAIDYKTGNATLKKRKELEAFLGGIPVVKLTGKAGELAKSLTKRFAHLTMAKMAKRAVLKKVAKAGLKLGIKALPIVGGLFTYSTAEGSQGERVTRAVAGEVGVGPIDLETMYDAAAAYRDWMEQEYEPEEIEMQHEMDARFDRPTMP